MLSFLCHYFLTTPPPLWLFLPLCLEYLIVSLTPSAYVPLKTSTHSSTSFLLVYKSELLREAVKLKKPVKSFSAFWFNEFNVIMPRDDFHRSFPIGSMAWTVATVVKRMRKTPPFLFGSSAVREAFRAIEVWAPSFSRPACLSFVASPRAAGPIVGRPATEEWGGVGGGMMMGKAEAYLRPLRWQTVSHPSD